MFERILNVILCKLFMSLQLTAILMYANVSINLKLNAFYKVIIYAF